MKANHSTLRYISFGRNRVPNEMITDLCTRYKEFCHLETICLTHMVDLAKFDFGKMLNDVAKMSEGRKAITI